MSCWFMFFSYDVAVVGVSNPRRLLTRYFGGHGVGLWCVIVKKICGHPIKEDLSCFRLMVVFFFHLCETLLHWSPTSPPR